MRIASRSIGRPIRCFLLIATAGVVLAADDSWQTSLVFDFNKAANWLSYFTWEEKAAPDPLPVVEPENASAPQLSMTRLLNGLLFSRPATSWRLDSSAGIAAIRTVQATSGPIVEVNGASLPTGYFSSGFVSYSAPVTDPMPNAPTATGSWTSNASGNWSNTANWQGAVVADGAGNTAHFDTLNITTDVTVTLDSSRTIGDLAIGDTDGTHHYSIVPSSGSSLTFDEGLTGPLTSTITQSATSAGDTISANIFLHNSLTVTNNSANQLILSGDIASSAVPSQFPTLAFNGNISVSGNIKNGVTGDSVLVLVQGGTVVLSGTNTYTRGTEVDGGTLLINGNNSGANGGVFVNNGGTLGGHGTVGGNVFAFGGTITGDTATTVGTLTLTGNLTLHTGESAGGTYLANLSGSLSDLLAISGTLALGSDTKLNIVGSADGTTTYTIATFSSLVNNAQFGTVTGLPSGYSLVYNATDIELVPIPEPATWGAAALALGALALMSRKARRAKSATSPA